MVEFLTNGPVWLAAIVLVLLALAGLGFAVLILKLWFRDAPHGED